MFNNVTGTLMAEYSALQSSRPLFGVHFWRIILDEAHVIKSSKTQALLC